MLEFRNPRGLFLDNVIVEQGDNVIVKQDALALDTKWTDILMRNSASALWEPPGIRRMIRRFV